MLKRALLCVLVLTAIMFASGCGKTFNGNSSTDSQTSAAAVSDNVLPGKINTVRFTPEPGIAPVPRVFGLVSVGALQEIDLSWQCTVDRVIGYNVYRSSDGEIFTRINASPVTRTFCIDKIPSPDGDGIVYYYKVKAVTIRGESDFSNTTKNLHGTRLVSCESGFTTVPDHSPYVAEGRVTINGGDLKVFRSSKLYLAPNSCIDIEQGYGLLVWFGLLRSVATTNEPAALTSHQTGGGAPDDGQGFYLNFFRAIDYDPADNSGTLLQNINANCLKSGDGAILVQYCCPKLFNSKFEANVLNGASYLELMPETSVIIEHCFFNKMVPSFSMTDLRPTPFKMEHNIFRGGYYSISFGNLANPGVLPGQIQYNDFDGSRPAYLWNMIGGEDVPLADNYWSAGTGLPPLPEEIQAGGTTIHYDFNMPLSSPPEGVGPNW